MAETDRLIALFAIAWGIGDTGSTLIASAQLGPSGEANPLIRWALQTHPLIVIGLKTVVVVISVLILKQIDFSRTPGYRLWLLTVTTLGIGITITNLWVAFQSF